MPTESKRQIKAARANTILLRYTIILLIAAVFAHGVLVGSYFLLTQTKDSQQKLIDANDTKAKAYDDTKSEIDGLSATLSGAKTTLDQQVLYSKVLTNVGASLPTGTVIEKLDLSEQSFTAPMTLKVFATTNEAAVTLRQQLSSSAYFTNVNLDSISESGGVDGYPISATLTLTLNRTIAQ